MKDFQDLDFAASVAVTIASALDRARSSSSRAAAAVRRSSGETIFYRSVRCGSCSRHVRPVALRHAGASVAPDEQKPERPTPNATRRVSFRPDRHERIDLRPLSGGQVAGGRRHRDQERRGSRSGECVVRREPRQPPVERPERSARPRDGRPESGQLQLWALGVGRWALGIGRWELRVGREWSAMYYRAPNGSPSEDEGGSA
jgi:hypothetical protein